MKTKNLKNHNRLLRPVIQAVADSGIAATGKNHYETSNGTFKHCFNPGARHFDEEFTINTQKMIPDGIIGARSMDNLSRPLCSSSQLHLVGLETLVELKMLRASMNRTNPGNKGFLMTS